VLRSPLSDVKKVARFKEAGGYAQLDQSVEAATLSSPFSSEGGELQLLREEVRSRTDRLRMAERRSS